MSWELRVALRYLTARRKQAFISVISGVAIVGVAVGVAAVLIALILFVNSFAIALRVWLRGRKRW